MNHSIDAGVIGRRVEVHVSRGHFHLAHAVIDEAEREATESTRPKSIDERLDTPLAQTGLELRILNALDDHGIITVRDLLHTPRERLEAMSDIGPSTLREIASVLAELKV